MPGAPWAASSTQISRRCFPLLSWRSCEIGRVTLITRIARYKNRAILRRTLPTTITREYLLYRDRRIARETLDSAKLRFAAMKRHCFFMTLADSLAKICPIITCALIGRANIPRDTSNISNDNYARHAFDSILDDNTRGKYDIAS